MNIKNISRLRRAKKARANIKIQESPRLTVFRSSKHFYAQIFDNLGSKVIVSASTAEKNLKIKSNNLKILEFSSIFSELKTPKHLERYVAIDVTVITKIILVDISAI